MTSLTVPARFCGPPHSGNGGWCAGALADLAPWPVATVRLSAPPPLDTPMDVAVDEQAGVATYDGTEVLRVSEADHDPVPVAPVTLAEAEAAAARYPGLEDHPFATCFGCGTAREVGDGLRIFPGPVRPDTSAGTWTPTETGTAIAWAALDCPGAWAAGIGDQLVVLGTMTARLERLPVVGEPHVVVAEARERAGRRTLTAATVYDADGSLVGTAEHVWIAVDRTRFN